MRLSPALAARIMDRVCEAGLLLIVPLVFHRGFAEQFSTPKIFLTKCFIILGLAVWALQRIWSSSRRQIPFPLGLPLLAFGGMALFSCLFSPVPRFSLLEVGIALCGPAWALLLVSGERGEARVRRVAILIAVAGGFVAAIALLQRCGFDPIVLGGYAVDWGSMAPRMRLYSTLGNPNYVGGYLIGAIFPAAALAAAAKARWAKLAWIGITLIMLAAIVATGSHGAWLGLVAGLAIAGTMLLPAGAASAQESAATFGGIEMLIPPSACWPLAILILPLAQRFATQFMGRIYLWRFSWPMFWRHPWVGSGWGTYQLQYLDLQGKFLAAHPEYVGYWTNNRLLHNDPLQLLLETGLLGFAALCWLLWSYGREARRVTNGCTDSWRRYAVAASVGGVTAILVDSFFNYQFAVAPTYILLFTLLAIPNLARNDVDEEAKGSAPPASPTKLPQLRLALKVAGGLSIVVAAVALLWQQGHVLASERYYQITWESEARSSLALAEAGFHRSLAANDLNGRAHFGLSRVLYATNRPAEALQEITLAEQAYSDPSEEALRARILATLGRKGEALAAYRHALWLDPALYRVEDMK